MVGSSLILGVFWFVVLFFLMFSVLPNKEV